MYPYLTTVVIVFLNVLENDTKKFIISFDNTNSEH